MADQLVLDLLDGLDHRLATELEGDVQAEEVRNRVDAMLGTVIDKIDDERVDFPEGGARGPADHLGVEQGTGGGAGEHEAA